MTKKELTLNTMVVKAVRDYEKQTGLQAINYRALPAKSTLRERLNAASKDLNWWDQHAQEASRSLRHAVSIATTELMVEEAISTSK